MDHTDIVVHNSNLNDILEVTVSSCDDETYASRSPQDICEQIIQEYDVDTLSSVLHTIRKYLMNCYKAPWNTKFRQFQLSYKVADSITMILGGIDLLLALQFEIYWTDDDYMVRIPISQDLDSMKNTIQMLCTNYHI